MVSPSYSYDFYSCLRTNEVITSYYNERTNEVITSYYKLLQVITSIVAFLKRIITAKLLQLLRSYWASYNLF
jgi:hypothetical protein